MLPTVIRIVVPHYCMQYVFMFCNYVDNITLGKVRCIYTGYYAQHVRFYVYTYLQYTIHVVQHNPGASPINPCSLHMYYMCEILLSHKLTYYFPERCNARITHCIPVQYTTYTDYVYPVHYIYLIVCCVMFTICPAVYSPRKGVYTVYAVGMYNTVLHM